MTAPPASDAKAFSTQKLALADRIRHDGRLSSSIRLIGAEICSLTNFRTGYSWAPQKYLSEKLSVTDRTIKRAIVELVAAGYLVVERVGRSNRYRPNFAALEQGTFLPLSDPQQGTNCHLSDENRGQKEPQQGTFSTENRGQKSPPISLEISLGISSGAEAGAVGAAPDGAAGPVFDLGVPGVVLRQRLGDEVFRSWLGKVGFVRVAEDELVLQAPSRFVASHIRSNFEGPVLAAWRVQHPSIVRLRVEVAPEVVTTLSEARGHAVNHADARWLVDVGISIVAARLHMTRASADRTLVGWLQRSGRDAAGLRRIIAEADQQNLDEQQFANVVKQRTRALLHADQPALKFGPEAIVKRRSAS
ncbi:helix-turn-helix domain-containing protein [Bradyrhizobium roseum]|uniref:helix-turn-helix domain-containing protein n=1 Tax=Bradyrhizobium roseum TaxID=3056648 RepID=UPI00261003E4|nr:DnaA N-terminal domain-containing protein [Bradyrhizobium roseus]WKA31583.1 DnaA N-terminal domain-containing protein [Bradyrhizobium roseus]